MWVGAALPHGRRGARCRPSPATSSSTGAAPHHVGGGSHGSLHANDSLGTLLWCGTGPDAPTRATQWTLRDIVPMVASTSASPGLSAASCAARALLALAPARRPDALARRPSYGAPPPGWRWRRPTRCGRSPRGRRCAPRAAEAARTYGRVYLQEPRQRRWQVSFFAPPSAHGRARRSRRSSSTTAAGACSRAWTGYKVEWTMARGYPGAFGRDRQRAVDLARRCALLFVLPFARPPLRLLHLDLAGAARVLGLLRVLQRGARSTSRVPLRLSAARLPARAHADASPRGREPPPAAAARAGRRRCGIATVFLIGFRCGLNVVGSNVIDVGYASVIGADHFGCRPAALRPLPARQPARRHLRPGRSTTPTSPFEALLPVERRLGRPAGRARRRGRLRPR